MAPEIEKMLDALKNYLNKLGPDLALARDAADAVSSLVKETEPVASALGILAGTQGSIWHDVKNPPTGTIALRDYQDLNAKDRVTVKVQFRTKGTSGVNEIEHTESYHLEVEKLNLHTSLAASLIFARAVSGDEEAQRWKSNVAAMVNWHYRHRHPRNGSEEMWNWLNPGAGVHLASLDQGDDTAEFGIGPGLTLWNGLMHAGFGWNLSQSDDREYFFVGVNLFHLLDIARGATGEATWQREIDAR